MPKVQTYDQGQVKARPLPASRFDANATADSFGGGKAKDLTTLGNALQSAGNDGGNAVVKYAAESKDRKDKAFVRDALNSAQSDARVFMADLNRPERRQDATEAYNLSSKELAAIRKKYSSNLKDPRQRDLFTASFDEVMNSHLDRASSLQEKSRVEFEKITIDAQNQTAVDDAVAARTDINEINRSEFTIRANARYKTRGLPEDVRKRAEQEEVNNLHSSILSALAQDSPVAAKDYLEKNKDKFTQGAAFVEKQKELTEKAFEFTVRQKAVEFSNSGLSLEDQFKEVDKIQDPKMADELRKRVKEKYDDKKLAAEAQAKQVLTDEWQKLTQDPRGYQIPYEKFTDKKEWEAMEAYKRAALNGYSEASDIPLLIQLGTASDEDLRQVPIETMAGYAKQLKESDWKAVFDRYSALRGGNGSRELSAGLTQIRSDTTLVSDALKSVGIDLTPKDAKNKGKRQKYEKVSDQFFRAYQSEVSQEELKLGRKATPVEKQQIVDDLLVKGRVKNPDWFAFNDANKFLFQVEGDEWKNFSVKEIPEEDQRKITDALNRAGQPVTKAAVTNLYIKKLQSRKS